MENDGISRTEIGSANPFDFLKSDQHEESHALDLDNPNPDTTLNTPPVQVPPVEGEEEETPPATPPASDETPPATPDGDKGDGEEEEEEDESSSAKVKIKTNVPKLLAERLKADGQLPEDFEVTEETTAKDVENAYRKYLSDNIREEVKNEAIEQLKADGYDDRVLNTAQKLHYGVPEQEVQLEEAYSALGSLSLDSSEENYEDLTKMLFQQYYLDKGLTPDEASANADRDFEHSDDVDALIQGRKAYFNNRSIELDEAHKEQIKEGKRLEKKRKEDNVKRINKFLDKGELDGVKYTKEEMETVRKALFDKTEVIVNEQGQRVRVTPYYKKKYERAQNEEQAMKDIVDFVLGYDVKKLSDKARKAARKGMVDELNDLLEVEVELGDKRKPASTPTPDSSQIVRKPLN